MPITRLQDIIQPEVFTPYVIQRTMELSAMYQSGIIGNDAELNALASGPNTLINMPHFIDLTGDAEIITDTGFLTPDKITTGMDVARKQARAHSWGANGLSALLSGADPMDAIAGLVADWWTRVMQRAALASLKGVFASPTMASKTLNISGLAGDAALWSASAFIDATQTMGDAKDQITAVVMHSAVEAYLAKQQLIQYETTADKGTRVPYYLGKRVIVDDAMPIDTATKTGTAYLFGPGALALGNGSHPRIISTEIDREKMSSSGEDFLVNRRLFILHPRGIKWTEASVADAYPVNAELSNPANWVRVYEEKAIRMVAFTFKIS